MGEWSYCDSQLGYYVQWVWFTQWVWHLCVVVVVLLGKGLLIMQAAEKEALKKEENKKKKKKTQPLNQDQGGSRGRRGHGGETRRNREGEGRGQESNQRKRSAMHTFFNDSDEEAEMVQRRKKPRGELLILYQIP